MTNYRLLRNNKETGPYTAEQIIRLGLKPYDLIWEDGRSAAWRYPGEMQEFKAYAPLVEEQPFDRFFKKEHLHQQDVIHSTCNTATALAEPPVKVKPRIRIKADWNKVGASAAAQVVSNQQPVSGQAIMKPPVPTQQTLPKTNRESTPSWESSWLDWQQEKSAAKQATKTQDDRETVTAATNTTPDEPVPVLETKFSQSLTEIKEKYAATILKAKTKAVEWRRFKNVAILGLLAIPVLCLGMWAGHKLGTNTDIEKSATVKSIIPNAQVAIVQPSDAANAAKNGTADDEQKPTIKKTTAKEVIPSFDDDAAKPEPKRNKTNKSQIGTTHYLPVSQRPAALKPVAANAVVAKKQPLAKNNRLVQQNAKQVQQPAQQKRYVFSNPSSNDPSARIKSVNPSLLNNQAIARQQQAAKNGNDDNDSPIFSHLSKKQRIEDFVTVDTDESPSVGAPNLKLNVQNLADFRLDLVVIDVEYFNANGRFKAGETMYVKNIPSGETLNVKVPDNPAATRIKYKVSLVSAEQKGVYLIAD